MSNEETKDCTRLPVVGFSWLDTAHFRRKIPTFCIVGHWHALCRLTDAQSLATDLRLELNAKRLKLCAVLKERNDAQARLAEKDAEVAKWKALAESMQGVAEIAQSGQERMERLRAHIRADNSEALANALAEVEDLATLVRRLVHSLSKAAPDSDLPEKALDYLSRKGLQGNPLRAQLAQLQAAPAERELALLREYRLSGIAFNDAQGEGYTLEQSNRAESRMEAAEKACWEFYRLNPAPATAEKPVFDERAIDRLARFIETVRECERLASDYSGTIDGVEEHGGDDHEDPICAVFHRLYYAMFDGYAVLAELRASIAPATADSDAPDKR